jgi:carbon starvation protein
MSEILSFLGGDAWKGFWYHFAIMFEALFILTTVDTGTRVARFMLSDSLGNLGGPLRKFRDPSWNIGAWICTALVVAGWGSILLMGVTDPLGGINTLYPLFGIANQLLAAIALTLVMTVVFKKGYRKWAWIPAIPLVWDLVVTMTASWQKIFSSQPSIGYWAQHRRYIDAEQFGSLNDAGNVMWEGSSFGTPDAVNAVIRNTFIQGTLSIVFAAVVIVIVIVGVIVSIKAVRAGSLPTSEEPDQLSHSFAPASLFSTKAEKALGRQWADYESRLTGASAQSPATANSHALTVADEAKEAVSGRADFGTGDLTVDGISDKVGDLAVDGTVDKDGDRVKDRASDLKDGEAVAQSGDDPPGSQK